MSEPVTNIGQVFIKVDGSDLSTEHSALLMDLVVEDDLAQPAMFELRFQDQEFSLIDGARFRLGAEVTISGADQQGRAGKIVVGEVTAIECELEQGGTVLLVRGYDRAHRLFRGRKTRTFLKQSDSGIAEQIAREAGLRADVESSSVRHDYVIQANQTDMEFLRARAARIGYAVRVDDRTLRFRRAESSPPRAPDQEWSISLLNLRTRQSAVAQPSEVQVRGWDPTAKRAIIGKASGASQPSQLGSDPSSTAAAQRAFDGAARVSVVDRPVQTQGEADAMAQAVLDDLSGAYVAAEGLCYGEPKLRAGSQVTIKGVGRRFGGTYFVSATRHSYSPSGGYQTSFYVTGRRPNSLLGGSEAAPQQGIAGVVVGIVTNNNDPDRQGRVKVRFPWLDDENESTWARLAAPGAGSSRGLQLVPEVNDEVLVAFEHGDMNRPYIVGGLWNGKDAPPANAVRGGNVELRTLKTREGHTVELDDSAGSGKITIKTKSGQVIVLNDSGMGGISIESKGTIELKGQGGKLSIAPSGVELSADATMTIKGQMVMIN